MNDGYNELTVEERSIYNSAVSVQRSEFWVYLLARMDELIEINKDDIVEKTIRGDQGGALIAASKIRGLELAKEEMDNIVNSLEVTTLNQELEEDYA